MADKRIDELTLDEKAALLTGASSMESCAVDRLGIKPRRFADASHGLRLAPEDNCTYFPNLCCLAASWDAGLARRMGETLADECIHRGVSMLLGPGVNIKKNILCGRNFEYFSEDPVLAGELAAAYIRGLEEKGVAACLKHFAANNQEKYRTEINVEVDERTLREIYLKAFEIAVKKGDPTAVMCAYNKVNAIWCSENRHLLTDILKDEWGYKGFVISDWGAVHDSCRAVAAGLDYQMPADQGLADKLRRGLESGRLTTEDIDAAAARVLPFMERELPASGRPYDRAAAHALARAIAGAGMTLLKNEGDTLPLTKDKYGKIGLLGGFADSPLLGGEGSADVFPDPAYVESTVDELRRLMPDTGFVYAPVVFKDTVPAHHLWGSVAREANELVADCDAVVFFIGGMQGDDTERYDRRSALMNENYTDLIRNIKKGNRKFIAVLESGSALIIEDWIDSLDACLFAWCGGEAMGGAIADVLTGTADSSGRLPETLPRRMRSDFEYPGTRERVAYDDKLNVGYRYYDRHPDEVAFPFGFGLSYTSFAYSDAEVSLGGGFVDVIFTLTNTGKRDGAETAQVYISDPESVVSRPVKELKAFEKVFLRAGESKRIHMRIPVDELAYYNVSLGDWVVEAGAYNVLIASSAADVRLSGTVIYEGDMPYTVKKDRDDMVG